MEEKQNRVRYTFNNRVHLNSNRVERWAPRPSEGSRQETNYHQNEDSKEILKSLVSI